MLVQPGTDDRRGAQADRLIAEYGILERTPDALQSVVELAAYVAAVPMATVNIITTRHQHQIAAVGFDPAICAREDSMCAVDLHLAEPVAVSDARLDPRYRDNPFVTGELGDVKYYASHPLLLRGVPIGTLCVFDEEPHEVDDERRGLLATLAERIVDILELERRAEQLRLALDHTEALRCELVRSNDQLSAFAGQISHDLASPLTAIAMSLELLHERFEDEPDAPASVGDWIETGLRGVTRMEAMIRDILTYARVGGELSRAAVDLTTLARAAADDLGVAEADARITVAPLPTLCVDATQMRALFQNLLSNALKFSPGVAQVEVTAHREQAMWRIEVADRGIGIADADVQRVFDPLVRAQSHIAGNGIGLSTCRRIVQAHGGGIGIHPREGGGSVAWFLLPADQD